MRLVLDEATLVMEPAGGGWYAATLDGWVTADARPDRATERWYNLLVTRRDVLSRTGW